MSDSSGAVISTQLQPVAAPTLPVSAMPQAAAAGYALVLVPPTPAYVPPSVPMLNASATSTYLSQLQAQHLATLSSLSAAHAAAAAAASVSPFALPAASLSAAQPAQAPVPAAVPASPVIRRFYTPHVRGGHMHIPPRPPSPDMATFPFRLPKPPEPLVAPVLADDSFVRPLARSSASTPAQPPPARLSSSSKMCFGSYFDPTVHHSGFQDDRAICEACRKASKLVVSDMRVLRVSPSQLPNKLRKPYKSFFAPISIKGEIFNAHQFSDLNGDILLLFSTEYEASRVKKLLQVTIEPHGENFRFCSYHKSFHPLVHFEAADTTCKKRLASRSHKGQLSRDLYGRERDRERNRERERGRDRSLSPSPRALASPPSLSLSPQPVHAQSHAHSHSHAHAHAHAHASSSSAAHPAAAANAEPAQGRAVNENASGVN